MKFKKVKLSKGGTLYYTKNTINTSTAVEIGFDCGSRCNTIDGLAHFVEHMFFTGTKTMSKEDVAKRYFDFIDVNAYTSLQEIKFDGKIFTSELGNYLKTVAMMITESTFSQANVNKEIHVVCQEIATKKLPEITKIEIPKENKVVIVHFSDGTKEKAVCDKDDKFSLETGIEICVMKKIMGGNAAYNKYIKNAVKLYNSEIDRKNKEDAEKERKKAKIEKEKERRERRRERKIAEQIHIQKEAYLLAMKEFSDI